MKQQQAIPTNEVSARPVRARVRRGQTHTRASGGQLTGIQPVLSNHGLLRRPAGVLQTRLVIGKPNDQFEQEADRMADQVMRMPGDGQDLDVSTFASSDHRLQRKCACGGTPGSTGECEDSSKKKRLGLQTKLKINEAGDIYEQEADQIADQVMATPAHHALSGAPPRMQRFSGQSNLQLGSAPASVDQVLASPGTPLEPALRQDMEQRFGYGFSRVRVHSGAVAEQSARDVNAKAYAIGHDIVFGAGQFEPGTNEGGRLLAHELTHALQQSDSAATVRRKPDESKQTTRPVPAWALTTPADVLPGVPVPGYESRKPKYTEVDRSNMLAALNTTVQLNGQRLAKFYHDLRMAWMDLIIELAVDDAGLSLGAQTVAGIIGNLIAAPLKTGPGLIVGIIADGIVNVTDEVMAENELNERKEKLRDMLVAPTVKDVGERNANGQLADLLLDAIGYATWLQVALPDDLWKFRIPPEFPDVPESNIRFEIAAAVLRYKSPPLRKEQLREAYDPYGTYFGGWKFLGEEVLQVAIVQGLETNLTWNLPTHPALMKSIMGHPISDLKELPLVVTFTGKYDDLPDWDVDYPPRAVFGRNTAGTIIVHDGNFLGLYQLHRYCHPDEKPLTHDDVYGPINQPQTPQDQEKRAEALRAHYRKYAQCGAAVLLQDFIDPSYLMPKRTR